MFYFFKIAKKEFDEYLRSNIVTFVLSVFFILFICSEYNTYLANQHYQYVVHGVGWGLPLIYEYGCLVAIVLGLSSMYGEFGTNAMNTLVVKPIYRDTILNGKLVGAIFFAFCIFIFSTFISMALNFMFYGSAFASNFTVFLNALPIIFILFLLCFMMFYLLTVLMFIIFKSSSFSLFLSFLSWMFIYILIPNMVFSSYISQLFPNNKEYVANLISGFSPMEITFDIMDGATNLMDTLNHSAFDFLKLFLYVIILLVLCYATFLRRDIR